MQDRFHKNYTVVQREKFENFKEQFALDVLTGLSAKKKYISSKYFYKDIDALLYAYNDRQGKTKLFNLNILKRINRELGGDFDLKSFQHYGTYNAYAGAMESYLVSLKEQNVFIKIT